MKQQCFLAMVWLTWLAVPALALLVGYSLGWLAALLVVLAAVVAQLAYLRWFPRLSRLLGYGSVADVAGSPSTSDAPPKVILYTASVCPFCPIVRRRLERLQPELGFVLEEVDVTFRPQVIREKGLRSVPALEAEDRLLVGNATSAELSEFLAEAAARSRTTT